MVKLIEQELGVTVNIFRYRWQKKKENQSSLKKNKI